NVYGPRSTLSAARRRNVSQLNHTVPRRLFDRLASEISEAASDMTEWDDEANPEVDPGDLALRILEIRSADALEYPEVRGPLFPSDPIGRLLTEPSSIGAIQAANESRKLEAREEHTGRFWVGCTFVLVKPEGINKDDRVVPGICVEVHVPTCKADRIFADEAGESGMVVPRPRVTPTASLAGISTPTLMRGAAASASSSGGARGRARSR